MKELLKTLRTVKGYGLASIVAQSDLHERLTKKARSTKEPLPAWAIGLIGLTRSSVSVGHDYAKAVQNQQAEGFAKFEAEESKISRPVADWPNNLLRESIRNPEQFYLRVFVGMGQDGTKPETFYFNALGENVTSLVTEQFKADFFPIQSGSVKQALAGSEKEVQPREYKLENIKYFQRGESVYNGLTPELYDLFNLVDVGA